jgi:16S rRNA (cytidine1402-2'-O)-methyltransferase
MRRSLPPPALDDAPLAPGLYVVATPIGNLRDITLRALDVLAQADLVLAEDTRVAAKLLSAFGLSRPLDRYDEHAAERTRPKALQALADGRRVALVSDAGTPLVSDPGYRLVREAAEAGFPVIPIPCWRGWRPRACPPTASCSPAFRRRRAPRGAAFWKSWPACAPP